jgi:uncharacterized membrane protein
MSQVPYLVAAVLSVAGLGVVSWHAWPDREKLWLIATAVVYGFLLEQGAIVVFERYAYHLSGFPMTLLDVPLTIAFAWAAIVYSALETAEKLGLDDATLPAFTALYLLHIDLAIDAVAIRVPFWTWANDGVWFGVPVNNFVGWYLIGLLFAGAYVLLRDRIDSRPLRMTATLATAVVSLIVLLELWLRAVAAHGLLARAVGFSLMVLAALVVVARADITPRPVSVFVAAIPITIHLFYLALLLGYGYYLDQPLVLVVSLAMLLLGVALHAFPVLHARRHAGTGARS